MTYTSKVIITCKACRTEVGPFGHEHSTECRVLSLACVSENGPIRTVPAESDRCPAHTSWCIYQVRLRLTPDPGTTSASFGLPSVSLASLFPLATSLLLLAGG